LKLVADIKEESKEKPDKFGPDFKSIITNINAENIVKMIEPEFEFQDIVVDGLNFTDFFSSIISSFPIDVDRMDYLLRDSYFSGVNYGLYDLSRLFMSLLPVVKEKKVKIALKESGLESVVRFIQSRTHLYNQIYYHKTNRSANKLLDFCCRELLENKKSLVNSKSYKELEHFYWTNSDELFLWNTLEKIIDKKSIEYQVLLELQQRRLWKRVYEKTFLKDEFNKVFEKNVKQHVALISEKLKDMEPNLYSTVDVVFSPSMKDAEKSKISYFFKEGESYGLNENFWEANSVFQLNKIRYTEVFVRIYLRRDFSNAKQYMEQKQKILRGAKIEINALESLFAAKQ
jgi:HD superfamily phosphohydrolase